MTDSDRDETTQHLAVALTRSAPLTALRHGLLAFVHDELRHRGHPDHAATLAHAAQPLAAELDCHGPAGVDAALAALTGRPRRGVTRAAHDDHLRDRLAVSLDVLGAEAAAAAVRAWQPVGPAELVLPPTAEGQRAQRAELVEALRQRAAEVLGHWYSVGVQFGSRSVPPVDGRALTAAARAWQLPLQGEVPPLPSASSARHPNRLGRVSAAVAFARLRAAMHTEVPDDVLFGAVALLVAVAEAVSDDRAVAQTGPGDVRRSGRVSLPVRVRLGDPVADDGSSALARWWPVLDSWGATSRAMAAAIPTAWHLSPVEGDVLVWALSAVAATVGMASSFTPRTARALGSVSWPEHVAVSAPEWERGAWSVWGLLQLGRRASARSAWPGQLLVPSVRDAGSWPWQTEGGSGFEEV